MDAFQRAVEDARRQLSLIEGQTIGVSELLRRAGFPDQAQGDGLTMKGARYHLEPGNNRVRKGGHRVPAELVTRLAEVLRPVISEDELLRAAQVAAGFTVQVDTGDPDIPGMLVRYLGDQEVTEEEKQATASRLLQIIAEQSARARRSP